MSKPQPSIASAFSTSLESALKKYHDPKWLGAHSVLASPYFLGEQPKTDLTTDHSRGKALQALLRSAVAEIQGENAQRYQAILTLRYFNRNVSVEAAMRKVGLSKNAFHENRRKAIRALEATLVGLVHPSLRLETPPYVRDAFPRPVDLERLRRHVADDEDVTIQGPEGSGRSTLAANFVRESTRPALWFTVRPGLNDSVQGFAFSLGLFAFTQGEPSLWLQLLAAQGSLDAEILRSQINYALGNLASPPLICIDDADALDTAGNPEHRALVQLWDGLRPLSTLIVIGRHEQFSSSRLLQVHNLSPAETEQFFTHCGQSMSAEEMARYYQWTQGNLRLLHLCCSIFPTAPEERAIPDPAADAFTRRLLLANLLAKLSETELRILATLSVYRRPFPLNYPPGSPEYAACKTLHAQRILNVATDGNGELVAVYRRFVYASLRPEVAQVFHSLAAELRSAYGEYAATIYHLLRARRFAEAIDLWPTVKRQEMEQGQAGALLAAFRDALATGPLPDEVRSVLTLYCAELNQFLGNIEQAKVDTASDKHLVPIFDAELGELKGRIANDLDHFAEAQEAFDRALERADLLLESRLAQVHKGLAWMHLRQRDLELAERELDFALFEIENMRGNLAYDQARYDDATGHYEAALRLADDLKSPNAGAKTRLNLAMVYMVQGCYDDSLELLNRVYAHYEAMHRVAAMAGCRITMAVAHNLAGEHQYALTCLDDADDKLNMVDKIVPWQTALIAQARAEAWLGLGDLAAATTHVVSAIDADVMSILPDAYRTYGEILTRQEDWAQAEKHLRQSVALAQKNEDRLLLAYAWRALGALYLVQGKWDAVRSASNTAITLFESLHLPNEVARTRRLFGR